MTTPLKILHVETGMNLYGGALQVLYLIQGLGKYSDVENSLVCPKGSAIAEKIGSRVTRLYQTPVAGDLDLLFLQKLVSILRRQQPDIVHLHSRRGADALGLLSAKLAHTKSVLTRRVDNPEPSFIARLKYRMADRIITISQGISDVLIREGVPSAKITCVPSAVDAGRYDLPCDDVWFMEEFGLVQGTLSCGVVAQFIGRKGHRFLIQAIPKILQAVPSAVFLLFGKGPLENDLKTECRRLNLETRVLFPGFREDLHRILGCLDLVIHPAIMEGLGVCLLQASAAGVPVVAFRTGGTPEAVMDGVSGRLVNPGNSEHLAKAVIELLSDRDLSRQMGEAGRRFVRERFSIEAMAKGNLAVYRSLTET
jgi:glycosyltransferase involved in cell wall biosynthesis